MEIKDLENQIFNADCLELMREIPDKSIDCVITDPPYGMTACKWDMVIPFEPMWEQLNRIIKPKGVILLFAQTPFDKILGASNISNLKYEWIWEKTQASGHLNAKKMPMKSHENILVFYTKLPTYNPQKTQGHKPMNSGVRTNSLKNENYNEINKIDLPFGGNTDRFPRSVIQFKSDKQKSYLHPTQKPVALMEYLIKTYTNENELVLDFTMGSGTTGVACKNTNRRGIGIEMDDKYFEIAQDRINGTL